MYLSYVSYAVGRIPPFCCGQGERKPRLTGQKPRREFPFAICHVCKAVVIVHREGKDKAGVKKTGK